jgi:hypothetical protein
VTGLTTLLPAEREESILSSAPEKEADSCADNFLLAPALAFSFLSNKKETSLVCPQTQVSFSLEYMYQDCESVNTETRPRALFSLSPISCSSRLALS